MAPDAAGQAGAGWLLRLLTERGSSDDARTAIFGWASAPTLCALRLTCRALRGTVDQHRADFNTDEIVLLGGDSGDERGSLFVHHFCRSAGSWNPLPRMSVRRAGAAACGGSYGLLVAGGRPGCSHGRHAYASAGKTTKTTPPRP